MKTITGEVFRVGRKLAPGDGKDVEDCDAMTPRYLFQPRIEPLDLPLIFSAHRRRNPRRARDVGNVRHDDLSLRLLLESGEDLFVVLRKLFDREAVADVVDADSARDQLRRLVDAGLQLSAQQVSRRRSAHT